MVLVEKQPAAQVVETMTFESKLYGTLAANLIHELVLVAGKLGSYIGYTGTSRILFTASRAVSEHLAEAVAPPTAAQASAYIR